MSFSLIILAGGNSHRFRSNIGKPYQKIAGKSLLEINIDKALKFKQIKKIILVYNKKDSKRVKSLKLKNVKLVLGGKNRQQSTFNALKQFKATFPPITKTNQLADFLFRCAILCPCTLGKAPPPATTEKRRKDCRRRATTGPLPNSSGAWVP